MSRSRSSAELEGPGGGVVGEATGEAGREEVAGRPVCCQCSMKRTEREERERLCVW